ncbi:hypothetical protein B7P43_G10843 [Cryptotermes secundus]|uniref:Condensin-2 complex subunit H2 C-terminal domain-containing protein n=2 Tax=Cryptotermes secundus TaxID=105785 RepID=A0A2J7PIV9_9NEOP|nr:hypothetical protein B7P43_G10843 [Cryptotermes secundus]
MKCIEELSKDDSLGLTAINFVQAGLMVEQTTKVYALNVDYLWQFMNEVLEVLRMNKCSKNSKRRSETAENSENHEEVPRRRKKQAIFEDFEEIVPNVIDPDMKAEGRNEPIKPLPIQWHILTKSDWKRRKCNYKIFDVDGDTVVPSDYSVMLQTSRQGKLQTNMLKEVITDYSQADPTSRENLDELIHVLELLIHELGHSTAGCSADEDGDVEFAEETGLTPECLPTAAAPSAHAPTAPAEHPTLSSLPVTPPPSPEPIERSASDAKTHEGIKRSMSDAESEKEVCAAGLSARRRREKEHLVTVPSDPWEPVPFEEGMQDRPFKRRQTFKLPSDLKMLKPDEKKRKPGHEEKVQLMVEYHGTKMLCTYVDHSCFPLYPDFKKFCHRLMKQKKLLMRDQPKLCSIYKDQEELYRRLSRECDEDFLGFEDYEHELGEEEGFHGFPDEDEEAEEDVDSGNAAADPERNIVVPLPMAESPENEDVPFEDNVFSQTDSIADTSHEHMEADIARRVAEWEHYIRPKLKVARDRGHFDIHEVGTGILCSFPQSSAKVTLQFEQFAANKPTVDVPRYFLAALQLANTYNIEISQSAPGDLTMDCMEMTLLSPVRHHKALEDYEAPSQGDKRKRFVSGTGVCGSDSDGNSSPSRSICKHKRNKR